MKDNSCSFCNVSIIRKQKYGESKAFYILVDSRPITYLHSLLVPKRHVDLITHLDEKEWKELASLIRKLTVIFTDYFNTDGFNLLSNNGLSAGQTVSHIHFHYFPRKQGDRKNDFKNLCFPTEKDRIIMTDEEFKTKTAKLSQIVNDL